MQKAFWLILAALPVCAQAAEYGGGNGTAEDPYQIWTAAQMNTIGSNPLDWASHFKLMADIDMSGYTGTQYKIIGNATTKFTGSFDGNGFVIQSLQYSTTTSTSNVGLFGHAQNAVIRNVRLENVSISTHGNSAGGLAGINSGGSISDCFVNGSVSGNLNVGGLVGSNSGVLTACDSAGSVSGNKYIGGLVGNNTGGLSLCSSNAVVSSSLTTGQQAGGLVGRNGSALLISESFATGAVTGCDYVGGLIGFNVTGDVVNCFATGNCTGTWRVGGLVGCMENGEVIDSYSTGLVSGTDYVGGFIGSVNLTSLTACFWDTQTSGFVDGIGNMHPDPVELMGLATAQMMTRQTFLDAGWDLVAETANGSDDLWQVCLMDGYPRLSWTMNIVDYSCPFGVGVEDLGIFADCWLVHTSSRADLNGDDSVDLDDVTYLAARWLMVGCGTCDGADLSGDGNVTLADYAGLSADWLLQLDPGCQSADLDNSGRVRMEDLAIFASNWMRL